MKRTAAILLAAATALGAAPLASAATSVRVDDNREEWVTIGITTEVPGEGGVRNAIISYLIPENLDFVIDPFEKVGEVTQIYSPNYLVVNQCDVAITASLTFSIDERRAADRGVQVLENPAEVNQQDPALQDKQIYMEVAVPDRLELDPSGVHPADPDHDTPGRLDVSALSVPDGAYGAYSHADGCAGSKALISTQEGRTKLTYKLEKATYVEGTDPETMLFSEIAQRDGKVTGAAAFRFMGSVNPMAEWADGDVRVRAVFDVRGILDPDEPEGPDIEAPDTPGPSIAQESRNIEHPSNQALVISGVTLGYDNAHKASGIDHIEFSNGGGMENAILMDDDYVFDERAGTITIVNLDFNAYMADRGNVFTVVFDDSGSTRIRIKVNKVRVTT